MVKRITGADKTLPGQSCPGLIEAKRCWTDVRNVWPNFRGSHAPASLKHAAEALDQVLEHAHFRGSHAPASLKPSAGTSCSRPAGELPGQ